MTMMTMKMHARVRLLMGKVQVVVVVQVRSQRQVRHVRLVWPLVELEWAEVAEVVVTLMTYQVHLEVAHQTESVEHSSPQQQ